MRAVAFDVGARRTGVAVSDASGTLARPYRCLVGRDLVAQALRVIADLRAEDDGLHVVVVGLPRRLDGSDNAQTPHARAFASALASRSGLRVELQDERLTSVEAESRLALRERDWRARKARLDAAAAAVILQDFLDDPARSRGAESGAPPHDQV